MTDEQFSRVKDDIVPKMKKYESYVNENLDTYVRSMEQNLEVIKEAVGYGK